MEGKLSHIMITNDKGCLSKEEIEQLVHKAEKFRAKNESEATAAQFL